MYSTVLAIFDEYGAAQSAANALFHEGFTQSSIKLSPAQAKALPKTDSHWEMAHLLRAFFSNDQHADDADMYAQAVRRGAYLLSVEVSAQEQGEHVLDVVGRFHPVDLAQRPLEVQGTRH